MASSRLEKIGTIYSRITGLLRSGALKEEDKPIWYTIYRAFPPKYEPKYDRPAPNINIRSIFYAEDNARAYFHKNHSKSLGTYDLNDPNIQTSTKKFVSIYNKLKEEGIPEDELLQISYDTLKDDSSFSSKNQTSSERKTKNEPELSLASSFREAQRIEKTDSANINISVKDLFKD